MKIIKVISLIIVISQILYASQWSDRVNVSNREGEDYGSDYCIDNQGILHCVWVGYGLDDRSDQKIYYTSSSDDGETWSTSLVISDEIERKRRDPYIACDSDNNLYITYWDTPGIFSDNHIFYTIFDGNSWTAPDTLTNGYPESFYNKTVVDKNNKVYFFWYKESDGVIYYKTLQQGIWSDVKDITHYDSTFYVYSLKDVEIDKNDNIHFIYKYNNNPNYHFGSDTYVGYRYWDTTMDTLSKINRINDNKNQFGLDLTLDSNNQPHITWQEGWLTDNVNYIWADCSLYSFYNGRSWSIPDTIGVSKKVTYKEYPTLALDNKDNPHFTVSQFVGWYVNDLVYFSSDLLNPIHLEKGEQRILNNKLIYYKDKLYLVYSSYEKNSEKENIYFRKLDLTDTEIDNIGIKPLDHELIKNYPNPFNNSTRIEYQIPEISDVKISIYNLNGKLINIIVNKKQHTGKYNIKWNGKDINNRFVPSGLYFYTIETDQFVKTHKMTLLK